MATKTKSAAKDAGARHTIGGTGSGTWNGHDEHLIAGKIGTREYRSFVRFNVPWKTWNVRTLTSATLKLYRDKQHSTATTASSVKIQNMAKDWGETVYGSEGSWSSSPYYNWDNRAAYTSGARRVNTTVTAAVGTPNGNQYTEDAIDVTNLVMKWAPTNVIDTNGNTGKGYANYGFILLNADEDTDAKCLEWCSRETPDGASYYPQLTLVYDESAAPGAPINLWPSGGIGVQDIPKFKGSLNDSNEYDELAAARVKVYFDSSGNNLKWDSDVRARTGQDFVIKSGNPYWKIGKTYYWKAKTKDNSGLWGPFSALQSFTSTTLPPMPTGLLPEPGDIPGGTPVFSGVSKDKDPGGYIEYAQVNVYSDAAGTSVHWASGDVATGTTNSTFSVTYAGTGLNGGSSYYWKVRVKDNDGGYSPWSQLRLMNIPPTGVPYGLNSTKFNTLTPTLTATAPATMNAYQVIVMDKDGVQWSDTGTVASSGTAISHVYAGTALVWNSKFYWKVRTRNTSNVWSGYSYQAPFWTNASPSAVPVSPANGTATPIPLLVAGYGDADVSNGFSDPPTQLDVDLYDSAGTTLQHTVTKDQAAGLSDRQNSVMPYCELENFEDDILWRVTDGGYGTVTRDDTVYNTGSSSLKIANPGTVSADNILTVWPAGDTVGKRYQWDFSGYDTDLNVIRLNFRPSTLTGLTYVRMRFVDGANNWSEFNLSASAGSFTETAITTGTSPANSSGTLDWSDVIKLDVYANLSSYTGDLHFDRFRVYNSGTMLSRDTVYTWHAAYTDSSGAANATGSDSADNTFKVSALPAIKSLAVQASDLTAGDIHSPSPTVTWTFSGQNSKTQAWSRLKVYDTDIDGELMYDSGVIQGATASATVPEGIVSHGDTLHFLVEAADTEDLSIFNTVTYDVAFTPPADLTPIQTVADESTGAITITWPQSSLGSSAFNRYEIVRNDGVSDVIVYQTQDQTETEYVDYTAAYGVSYTYRVLQYETVSGSNPVPSQGLDESPAMVEGGDWQLVVPGYTEYTQVLYMRRHSHQDIVQQTEFEPFGRRSKVVQREGVMGAEGNLDIVVPSDELDDFKSDMNSILDLSIPVYIKSPFGDSWKSYIKPPKYSYLAGGHANVTIQFTEVD